MSDHRKLWNLIDNKESIIERWARDLLRYTPLAEFNLTARQRRVIARFRWDREVAKLSQDPMAGPTRPEQPQPIAGVDANRRVIVQHYDEREKRVRMWALSREGTPMDIKPPVRSLKDDRVVRIPPHIYVIEER